MLQLGLHFQLDECNIEWTPPFKHYICHTYSDTRVNQKDINETQSSNLPGHRYRMSSSNKVYLELNTIGRQSSTLPGHCVVEFLVASLNVICVFLLKTTSPFTGSV